MYEGVEIVAVRTPTLPPATHTNCWIVGEGRLTVVDPASPYEDEQRRLFEVLEERLACGEQVERILLTHHHHDHVSGAEALRASLAQRGRTVPVAAHPLTAERVAPRIQVDMTIEHGAEIEAGGRVLRAMFTPGHAPGHLVFQDQEAGWALAGDMVAGTGTILLHPAEGDLQQYLDSLALMRTARPTALLPSHGPVLKEADTLLSMYIAHRHLRTQQIREALVQAGALDPLALAPRVYADLPPEHWEIASQQITTHLAWMAARGLASALADGRWTA
jgi:glyoxylase-like metal-dependent hydrolase (beta-lactamase superfamily II)